MNAGDVVLRFLFVIGFAVLLAGCGSDSKSEAEKEAFRAQLIDKALNDDTRKIGDRFLAENAKSEGVVVRPSGLQYKVLTEARGSRPALDQYVVVNYQGRRVDGVVFDESSAERPATFPLKQVIKGWREGLSQMPKGAIWEFYIPPELAYGATSPTELIPANSTLIFTVELVDILDEADKEAQ